MSYDYDDIARMFVERVPPKPSHYAGKVTAGGWHGGGTRPGTRRMHHDGKTLWSYEHWPIAVWLGDVLLINGDGHSSVTTRKQQRALQQAVVNRLGLENARHAYIPFSALRAASLSPEEVKIIHMTPAFEREDKVTEKWRPRRYDGKCFGCDRTDEHTHEVTRVRHFLGETLFTAPQWGGDGERHTRYFVCGLDRNDNPLRRHFYLVRLPEKVSKLTVIGTASRVRRVLAKPQTVDEALDMLRPPLVQHAEGVVRRQGEWYFVPAAPTPAPKVKDLRKQVPIISDDPQAQATTTTPRDRTRRHVAARVYLNGAVYARGTVKDADHDTLDLGDQWHRVVRNLGDGSWSTDPNGVKVD